MCHSMKVMNEMIEKFVKFLMSDFVFREENGNIKYVGDSNLFTLTSTLGGSKVHEAKLIEEIMIFQDI